MGFIVFLIVLGIVANVIEDLSGFIADYGYWIGMALAALAGYRYLRGWWEQKEADQKKALEEEDRRRMAQVSPRNRVDLNKKKPLGDDEDDEDSYFSSIQHMSR